MLSVQNSVYQTYKYNRDNKIDFKPFGERKEHARTVIRGIAQTIFEKFGCASAFNDDCIKDLASMYEPSNFTVHLFNLKPTHSIFSFLLNISTDNFFRIDSDCTFTTDAFANLSKIEIKYFLVFRRHSKLVRDTISITFDNNFEVENINYHRINENRETTLHITKNRTMLCPIEEESMFIELILNDYNLDVREILPEFYQDGVYTFNIDDIQSNMNIERMLIT